MRGGLTLQDSIVLLRGKLQATSVQNRRISLICISRWSPSAGRCAETAPARSMKIRIIGKVEKARKWAPKRSRRLRQHAHLGSLTRLASAKALEAITPPQSFFVCSVDVWS